MATYKVLARDVKWAGKIYPQGATFVADGDKNIKLADLLVMIGKAEPSTPATPVGRVAETRALIAHTSAAEPAPAAAADPPPARPSGRYRTRRIAADN